MPIRRKRMRNSSMRRTDNITTGFRKTEDVVGFKIYIFNDSWWQGCKKLEYSLRDEKCKKKAIKIELTFTSSLFKRKTIISFANLTVHLHICIRYTKE